MEGIIRNIWLPYTERLPADLRPKFVSEVARRYIERYALGSGGGEASFEISAMRYGEILVRLKSLADPGAAKGMIESFFIL